MKLEDLVGVAANRDLFNDGEVRRLQLSFTALILRMHFVVVACDEEAANLDA